MGLQHFIIRVYGVLINSKNEVLLSNESYSGKAFTKFPGGGLERGEGPKDCILREFREELGIDINVIDHFYTTDFYQASAFNDKQQIISIYYRILAKENELRNAIEIANNNNQLPLHFKWIALEKLSETDVTFPIDKKVVRMLTSRQLPNDV